jgi:hypothetical protein
MATGPGGLLGVFALAALVTYQLLSLMHGHGSVLHLGHHMDSHPHRLNDRHDAFSFEPHVVAEAASRKHVGGGQVTPADPATPVESASARAAPATPPPPPPPAESSSSSLGGRRAGPGDRREEETLSSSSRSSAASGGGEGKFHVLLTANDAVYQRWQSRVMYYHYVKLREAHPGSALGGFTRILHSGHPDHLMDEIPTVVVDPLPPSIKDGGYVVLHRPYAFKQWLDRFADSVEEEYVLMSEPDHLHVAPMPLLATPTKAAAFPFFYINHNDQKFAKIVAKFNDVGAPKEAFAPIGNSPVMISKEQLREVVPKWHDLAVRMKNDAEADKAFGWVIEMWAYSIASAQVGVEYELHKEMMLQPPWDGEFKIQGKQAYIVHYTYGQDFDRRGRMTPGKVGEWHFDKRDFSQRAPKKGDITKPPEGATPVVKRLIEMIEEAMDAIPNWGD